IGGSGMLSLANLLLKSSFRVSGSDISLNEKIKKLMELGVDFYLGHKKENILDKDIIIYSSAIKETNEELLYSKKLNKEVYHRVDFLCKLMENKKTIGVAGTHGKTTTTSMISNIFKNANLSPQIYIGGETDEFIFGSDWGEGDIFVLETDEHDKSFLKFNISFPILTNIDKDHLDPNGPYKGDFSLLKESFIEFINKSKSKKAILCIDEPVTKEIMKDINVQIISYSIKDKDASFYGEIKEKNYLMQKISLYRDKKYIGDYTLKIPGFMNVLNSLASIAVSFEFNIDKKSAFSTLENFKGVKRRFEVLYDNLFTLIDDHADHPTEIETTLKVAREIYKNRRIILILEPHRYSRVYTLQDDYPKSTRFADTIIYLPIDPADELETFEMDSEILYDKTRKLYPQKEVFYFDKKSAILYLRNNIQRGDVVIFMGPGKIKNLVKEFLGECKTFK
ncbi:MAG: UDP-N-acetylmuramate--L-alanine ligase, partial [Caldisericia bacterium]|nr:UDP-N-acetylmuramate--L-alanine ligase [Caldisericia bacterium]